MPEGKKRRQYKTRRSKLVLLELAKDDNLLNVILFWNKKWDKFVTLGGRVDKNDDNFETALIREVKEESLNLLDISEVIYLSNRMMYIDFHNNHEKEVVRVYFLLIDHKLFDKDIYNKNKKTIVDSPFCVPRCWTELDGYDKFPIDVLLRQDATVLLGQCIDCENNNGQSKPLYSPVVKYIQEAHRQNIITELMNGEIVIGDCNVDKDASNTFLNGTETIKVK